MNLHRIFHVLLLAALIIISFYLYSYRHYPLLSSDDALTVLMTHYYELPHDFYCWGQDRGGTLIPLISQIFHKGFGLSAVNSVSLTTYLILILGYLGFAGLFRNRITRIVFAIVWFFPPARFVDLTRFPIGMAYSLVGISLLLISRIHGPGNRKWTDHLLMVLLVLILSASIWVSDLAIVTASVILLTPPTLHLIRTGKLPGLKPGIFYIVPGAVLCFLFIWYAKGKATGVTHDYLTVNDWETFSAGMKILGTKIFSILSFGIPDRLYSVYAWSGIGFVSYLMAHVSGRKVNMQENRVTWLMVFLTDFILVLMVLLTSRWVYLNHMGQWYFVASYVSMSMVLLLLFDQFKPGTRSMRICTTILLVTVLTGSFSTVHSLRYVRPGTLQSKVDIMSEFLILGEPGIIGEYWNSYITSCPDPSKIKATPHDKSTVRNRELADEVLARPNIYVIRDMWMDSFPDTLEQFGCLLVRKGEEFRMGGCDVQRYTSTRHENGAGR
jgi:hypothetical protein